MARARVSRMDTILHTLDYAHAALYYKSNWNDAYYRLCAMHRLEAAMKLIQPDPDKLNKRLARLCKEVK